MTDLKETKVGTPAGNAKTHEKKKTNILHITKQEKVKDFLMFCIIEKQLLGKFVIMRHFRTRGTFIS